MSSSLSLSAEQTLDIHRLVSLHGHLADIGDPDLFDRVYTDDIVYDLEALGYGTVHGRDALHAMTLATADRQPVGHHITNVIVSENADGEVTVRSKALAVQRDGHTASVVYEDRLRSTPAGWRIAHRAVLQPTAPLRA